MLVCILYIALWGLAAFPIGRLLRKRHFMPLAFPFRPFTFEKGGKIYDCLRIKQWAKLLPDISKTFSGYMPKKKLSTDIADIETFIQETCVAELIHGFLCCTGLLCIPLWPTGGIWVYIIYLILGNLPYIIIQRYNRPRLLRLLSRLKIREEITL